VSGAAPGDRAAARLRLGHVPVDAVRFDEAINRIEALVAARRGGCVFTPNVDHVVVAERHREFRAAYAAADLALADGGVLVLEHAKKQAAPASAGRLVRQRDVASGDSTLTFYGLGR
jgi:UDP-N-acetyl-D-mannosaminuronic acid transferase (WecB/TagA/CpsF family)